MSAAKKIAFLGTFTALLIAGQFALSFISGVEIVTALFLTFAFVCGVKMSLCVANAFSLLRCLVFGFFPSVLTLYLIFYNLFAIAVGALGNRFRHTAGWKTLLLLIAVAVVFTVFFTALDNVVTPLYYGYTRTAARAYAAASFAACIPQTVCAAVTVALLFPPLSRVFLRFVAPRAEEK